MLQLIGLKCKKSEEGEKCSSSYHCFHEEGRKEETLTFGVICFLLAGIAHVIQHSC